MRAGRNPRGMAQALKLLAFPSRAGMALALALISTPALADGFDNREIAFQALNMADAAETCAFTASGRGDEANPILRGRSCPEIVGIKAGFGLAHYAVSKFLEDRDPHAAKIWQIVSIVVQGGVVAANLRLVF